LENLVNKTKEKFGKVNILINVAGVSSQYPFQEQPIEDFEKLAHTNYLGYVRLIRLVINDMIRDKSGAIINIVSGSTLVDPVPRNFIVYSSLKVGLRAFCKGLFWELRDHGIKVTSLLPGVTDTDLTGKLKDVTSDTSRLMSTEAIENALRFALTVPQNVCPLEISVINQQTPWVAPIIPYKQQHPGK
jgi:short-subunit dehydrogenase